MPDRRKKPRLFVAAAIVVVGVLMELLAFAGLSLDLGQWATPRALHSERSALLSDRDAEANGDDEGARWSPEYVVHPYLGYVLDSRFDHIRRMEIGGSDSTNFGFDLVEPGLFFPPDPETLVVAVTGGSAALGLATHRADELRTRILEGAPAPVGRVVVLNLALPGFKQPQQLLTVNYLRALGAHFDVVVNVDGFNEIALGPAINSAQGVAPVFPYGWLHRVADFDPPARETLARMALEHDRRTTTARFFGRRPLRWSATAGLVWRLIDLRFAHRISEMESSLAAPTTDRQPTFTVRGPDRGLETIDAVILDQAAQWASASAIMHSLTEASGGLYLHFLQPNQYVEGSKPMTEVEARSVINPEEPSAAYVRRGYPVLSDYGERLSAQGVRFVDLSMLFQDVEEPTYFDDCCHYNDLGEELVAAAVARAVVEELNRPR
jgi:hypothetical protein